MNRSSFLKTIAGAATVVAAAPLTSATPATPTQREQKDSLFLPVRINNGTCPRSAAEHDPAYPHMLHTMVMGTSKDLRLDDPLVKQLSVSAYPIYGSTGEDLIEGVIRSAAFIVAEMEREAGGHDAEWGSVRLMSLCKQFSRNIIPSLL